MQSGTTHASGFFLKKKPPFTALKKGYVCSESALKLALEDAEPALQFPLRRRFLAAVKKRLAGGGRVIRPGHLAMTHARRDGLHVRYAPQARPRKKIVLHPGAGQLLQILIAQVVIERGSRVFMRDVDAADPLIIR